MWIKPEVALPPIHTFIEDTWVKDVPDCIWIEVPVSINVKVKYKDGSEGNAYYQYCRESWIGEENVYDVGEVIEWEL